MRIPRPNASARGRRRSAPRPVTAALTELLRAHRPPTTIGETHDIWICLTPALAAAIARIAARRAGSIEDYRDHPAHEAARNATRVSLTTAAEWRRDAWQAADEGLIGTAEALLLTAQIDPSSAA